MQWPNFDVSFMKNRAVMEKNLIFFLVLKYIIFVKIIKNVTDVIVPGFTWRHHVRFPLLWHVFSWRVFRFFQRFLQWFFYMFCRVSNISLFLCYCYFFSQVYVIFRVNYGCSERTAFFGRRFRHNIWYPFLMGEWGFTRISKIYISPIDCDALFSTLGHLIGVSDDCFNISCTSVIG